MGEASGSGVPKLARIARRLQAQSGFSGLPALWFLTDRVRTPDPVIVAAGLPPGTAVILRHYEAPDRRRLAHALADRARARGLLLFVGADAALAREVGAAGLHLPTWLDWKDPPPTDLHVSAAVHGARDLRRRRAIADALVVSPVFATLSHPGAAGLGPMRLAAMARGARRPVIALGGINCATARRLIGTGVAGIAATGAIMTEK
jgi:thiamine-phosphate pyrophosphorylase